jgi:hypothetical protein
MVSAKDIIKGAYGSSKNFMTPNLISYGKISSDVAYELSSGRGLFNSMLYGVSFAKINIDGTYEKVYDLSKSFESLDEAKRYIEKLKR